MMKGRGESSQASSEEPCLEASREEAGREGEGSSHKQRKSDLIQENLASLGAFISGISHELNNPLTGISLNLQNLIANIEQMEKGQILRRLRMISPDLQRASLIVADILNLANPGKPRFIRSNFLQTVKKSVDTCCRIYPALARKVEWKIEGEPFVFLYQPDRIERLLINLFRNSLQALNYRHGYIRVLWRRRHAHLRVLLEDNAGGMAPQIRKMAFQPFYSHKWKSHGSGLGLAICMNIVVEHEGKLRLRSSDGKSSFLITLPVRDPQDEKSP